jgi:hypothetical protein
MLLGVFVEHLPRAPSRLQGCDKSASKPQMEKVPRYCAARGEENDIRRRRKLH